MRAARDEILRRITAALRDLPPSEEPEESPLDRAYRLRADSPHHDLVQLFAERVAEYRATVHHVPHAELPAAIANALTRRHVRRLAVPADIPAAWLPTQVDVFRDEGLSWEQLDDVDAVLTGCAVAVALTGTIALDGGPTQGRRALSLIPDYHVCVVAEEQIVGLVPEAMEILHDRALAGRPITLISGPSATSDIELVRVEGVHGPRTLEVLIVE